MKKWNKNTNIIVENEPVEQFIFPSGELNIRLPNTTKSFGYKTQCDIIVKLKNTNDMMALFLTTNAIREIKPKIKIRLFIGYVPYARQDRVCNEGESFSIKVFCDLINSQKYDDVIILDPHSDVTSVLLNNVTIISDADFFVKSILPKFSSNETKLFNIVSPDLGASKKTLNLVKHFYNNFENGKAHIFQFLKERELKSGELLHTKCMNDLSNIKGQSFYIFDDIISSGNTIIEIAKLLKENGAGDLYVVASHGTFSNGITELKKYFTKIYVTNSYCEMKTSQSDNFEIFDWVSLALSVI